MKERKRFKMDIVPDETENIISVLTDAGYHISRIDQYTLQPQWDKRGRSYIVHLYKEPDASQVGGKDV